MLYENDTYSLILNVAGCEVMYCPLHLFENVTREMTPRDFEKDCGEIGDFNFHGITTC
uniref:Uncharacterized protein n=1 Tax=Bracon brevicornis TaxID=1563983 RepID=A0A6V7JL33_9HYME